MNVFDHISIEDLLENGLDLIISCFQSLNQIGIPFQGIKLSKEQKKDAEAKLTQKREKIEYLRGEIKDAIWNDPNEKYFIVKAQSTVLGSSEYTFSLIQKNGPKVVNLTKGPEDVQIATLVDILRRSGIRKVYTISYSEEGKFLGHEGVLDFPFSYFMKRIGEHELEWFETDNIQVIDISDIYLR